MRFLRASSLLGFVILCMLLLAACGNSTNTTTTTPSYGSGNTTPAASQTKPTAATSGVTVVKTMTKTVKGKSETVLTNTKGLTLYYFTPDTKTSSTCTTGCVDNWPPLLMTGAGTTPTSATPLTGKLTTQSSTNGEQVQYNGHFLYTFASDKDAEDTYGEGIGGKWFVATPDLAALQ
jgi:predicted lipoprotein with Yx(FWY)xxD motif